MYLGDLTFIEDGNMLRSDFDQNLVHYSKWKLAANVIQKIQSFQRLGYVFEELPPIQTWLASVRFMLVLYYVHQLRSFWRVSRVRGHYASFADSCIAAGRSVG